MKQTTPPTDQRAKVKPISFVLNRGFQFDDPVTLTIRPEDMTRNEPSRVSVHQTLGRDVSGWADDFGEGLGSVTIAGHSGWGAGGRADGAVAFERLNQLVVHDYHKARQDAIDYGVDPSSVKLIFIDVLDGFAWNVSPTQFVLRRSKSRPLLFQYNISLQAISTSAENIVPVIPFFGNTTTGLRALNSTIAKLRSFVNQIKRMVASAVGYVNVALAPIAQTVKEFVGLSTDVFQTVSDGVASIEGGSAATRNNAISIATDMSRIGANIFKTFSAISNLPSSLKADLGQVGSAFNEAYCIFKNSLRPAKFYEDYTGLYGASNCSSTTGGNPASIYADKNSFDLMQAGRSSVPMSSSSFSSMSSLVRVDPVLAPMPIAEMNRHLTAVNSGIGL